MKKIKKIGALFMAAALMCSTMILGGCSSSDSNEDSKVDANGEVEYKVTAKDAIGNVYTSGVIAKFSQNGEQVAMQVCDENGVAAKKLKAGDYDVELSFTAGDDAYHYNKEGLKVTAEKNELEVIVAYAVDKEVSRDLYVDTKEFEAYSVGDGCTYVDLSTEDRNYFLYTPTQAGTYEISIADDSNVEIGYYGAPHYVQSISAAEVTDNAFTVSVSASMIGTGDTGTTVLVIGIDAADADTKNCVLAVERIGDAEHTIADEPWTVYETTATLSKYSLPAGASLAKFDIKAASDAYNLVYNETDGYYHLDSADGPLVLVYLTKDNEYVSCYKTILENTGVNKYFYDENGEFVKKESYTDCLLEYIEYVDETNGVYPLTEDLKYIIQQAGEHSGWYNADGNGYLFKDSNGVNDKTVNSDIAWLFMCCYISD